VSACGSPKHCSLLIDCTCNCTNGSTNQIIGRVCADAAESGDCNEWAATKRESTEAACLAACTKSHGDTTATCQFALLPGNPVATVNNNTCPTR
jgi:hypothetical protein